MKKLSFLLCLVLSVLIVVAVSAYAQKKFPSRTITIVSPSAAGGGTDLTARNLGREAEKLLGTDIVVKNVVGAGNAVGLSEVYTSKADGYTLVLSPMEIVLLPMMGRVPWKSTDFEPIIMANSAPAALTVHSSSPWKTTAEFITAAKAANGKMKMGGSAAGTIWHLSALGFADASGATFNVIPYSGGAAPAIQDLMGKNLDATVVGSGEVSDQVEAGVLRVLCIMSDKRDTNHYPNVPTCKEDGVDITIGTWWGLYAPPKTPAEELKILREAFDKAWHSENYQTFLNRQGLIPMFMTADEIPAFMEAQRVQFTPLLKKVDLLAK